MKKIPGFTLIELLTVVTILAITAMIVVPNLSSTAPSRLDLAAEYYASAIRFARSESMRTRSPHGFEQNDVERFLKVKKVYFSTTPWVMSDDVYDPISKKIYHVYLSKLVGADHISTTASFNFRNTCNSGNKIYFSSNGVAWCLDPERVGLVRYDVSLTLGSHSRVVSLDGITGRVTIQ